MKRIKIYDAEEFDNNEKPHKYKPKKVKTKIQYDGDNLPHKKKDSWIGMNIRNENRR